MNKRENKLYLKYILSTDKSIDECYVKPSDRKRKIWDYIKLDCKVHDGVNLKVISYNAHMFTCGYTFCEKGHQYFKYFSPKHTLTIKIL